MKEEKTREQLEAEKLYKVLVKDIDSGQFKFIDKPVEFYWSGRSYWYIRCHYAEEGVLKYMDIQVRDKGKVQE